MTITPKQLEDRRKGLGSSDASAIMGANPNKSQHDVWREKMGIEPPFEGNALTDFGNKAEGMLRECAADYIGMPVVAPKGPFVKGVLRANVDGQVGKYGRGQPIVECKTTRVDEGWGTPGTDQVPAMVAIQVHHQMLAADSDFAYVIRLAKYLQIEVFEVPLNGDLARSVWDQCNAWWKKYMVGEQEPPITPATDQTLDYYANYQRDNQIEAMINDDLIEQYVQAQQAEKAAEQNRKDARARIMQAMGNASAGIGIGRRAKIIACSGRTSFNHKLLQAHEPELFEKYATVGSPFTQLRISKDKES